MSNLIPAGYSCWKLFVVITALWNQNDQFFNFVQMQLGCAVSSKCSLAAQWPNSSRSMRLRRRPQPDNEMPNSRSSPMTIETAKLVKSYVFLPLCLRLSIGKRCRRTSCRNCKWSDTQAAQAISLDVKSIEQLCLLSCCKYYHNFDLSARKVGNFAP